MTEIPAGSVSDIKRDIEDQMEMEQEHQENFMEKREKEFDRLQGNLEGWLTRFRAEIDIVLPTEPDARVALRTVDLQLQAFMKKVKEDYYKNDTKEALIHTTKMMEGLALVVSDMVAKQNAITMSMRSWVLTMEKWDQILKERVNANSLNLQTEEQPEYVEEEPLTEEKLSNEEAKHFDRQAMSVGRDDRQNDPLCLSRIIEEFTLKGFDTETVAHIKDEEFRKEVQKDRKCWCIDQAIVLLRMGLSGNVSGYFAALEMYHTVECAVLLGKGGVPWGQYWKSHKALIETEEWKLVKNQVARVIFNDERLKRKMCMAAMIMLFGKPEVQQKLEISKQEMSDLLEVIYCGSGPYMCGWQKSDLEHKFEPKWSGDNRLGKLIRERILNSWDAFVEWFNDVAEVDIDTLVTMIEQAMELTKIWHVNWEHWEDTKARVRPNKWEFLGHLPEALKRKVSAKLKGALGHRRSSQSTSISTSESREDRSRSTDARRSYQGSGNRDRSRSLRRGHDDRDRGAQQGQSQYTPPGNWGGYNRGYSSARGSRGGYESGYSRFQPPPPPPRYSRDGGVQGARGRSVGPPGQEFVPAGRGGYNPRNTSGIPADRGHTYINRHQEQQGITQDWSRVRQFNKNKNVTGFQAEDDTRMDTSPHEDKECRNVDVNFGKTPGSSKSYADALQNTREQRHSGASTPGTSRRETVESPGL
ncbi:MAG: hypothetical protein GY696_12475 [Gammaproteobacteria bacterium]|nr:hypothetical protein [Gammaproteobacteria bacterium]